jgi:hypothetical protein
MTGNELMQILSVIPDNQMEFPIIFIDTSNPDVSYGIDQVGVIKSNFIALKSID